MIAETRPRPNRGRRTTVAGTALLAALLISGALSSNRPAEAGAGTGAAAAAASAGVGSCSSSGGSGKAVYDCVGNVLDKLSNDIAGFKIPEAQSAIQTAARQVRAATNKSQALSAISLCRAAITAVIRQSASVGIERKGLQAITGVLAQAARLIQAKG